MPQSRPDSMIRTTLTARLLKPVLFAVLLLCLCLAGLVLLNTGADLDAALFADNPLLLPALLLQIFATALFIKAWQSIIRLQHDIRYGFVECTAHIGITLLGKYLPGKIWGLVGRSVLMTRRGQSLGVTMNLFLADQFVTFYTGTAIGISALGGWYSAPLGGLCAIVSLALIPLCVRNYSPLLKWLLKHLQFLTKRIGTEQSALEFQPETPAFTWAFLVYIAHWLTMVAVLCLLFYPLLDNEPVSGILAVTAAIPLAILSGFLAVWAPGGIGVREGVIVAVLSLQLTFEQALAIAIGYRMICIAVDLTTGIIALLYLSKAGQDLLAVNTDPD